MFSQNFRTRKPLNFRRLTAAATLLAVLSFGVALGGDLFRSLSADIRTYNNVVKNLLSEYVDDIDSRRLITASIEGMLTDLDPYTVFIREEDQPNIDMLTSGSYGGVGIRLGTRQNVLTVISPMEGTPASRAGVRPGDAIIKIDSVETADFSTDKAARLIRGKPGSSVTLLFKRPGEKEPFPVVLVREKIKVNDIPFYGVLDGAGYINMTRFSKNTARQIAEAIKEMEEQGMNGLVLDLRGNPGGLLRDAVAMVDAMVPPGQDIVNTKGRTKKSKRSYKSEKAPVLSANTPLVILVNGGSASASEIVAGAIQDLDRGVIIGTETFGKGLVQSIFPLSRTTAIKMTTAKYYIPSGRLIQKEDYRDNDVFTDGDSNRDSLFTTRNGREVHGGGGITPDIEVEQAKLGPLTRKLWNGGHFFGFAAHHQMKYDLNLPLELTDAMVSDFRDYIATLDIDLTLPGEKDLETFQESLRKLENFEGAVDFSDLTGHFEAARKGAFDKEIVSIRRGLLLELSAISGGLQARIQASLRDDPVYQQALSTLADRVAYEAMLAPPYGTTQLGSRD